jgi:hypothetical protein
LILGFEVGMGEKSKGLLLDQPQKYILLLKYLRQVGAWIRPKFQWAKNKTK